MWRAATTPHMQSIRTWSRRGGEEGGGQRDAVQAAGGEERCVNSAQGIILAEHAPDTGCPSPAPLLQRQGRLHQQHCWHPGCGRGGWRTGRAMYMRLRLSQAGRGHALNGISCTPPILTGAGTQVAYAGELCQVAVFFVGLQPFPLSSRNRAACTQCAPLPPAAAHAPCRSCPLLLLMHPAAPVPCGCACTLPLRKDR